MSRNVDLSQGARGTFGSFHIFYITSYGISLVISRSFFPFQNNPKYLDPPYKMDLDLWDCLGRAKIVILQNFLGMI